MTDIILIIAAQHYMGLGNWLWWMYGVFVALQVIGAVGKTR